MQIDRSEEQSANAAPPRVDSLQPGSNATLESCSQFLKQQPEMVSIDDGMQIDRSDRQSPNAPASNIEIVVPDSNVKLESWSQPSKQDPEITATDAGTWND
jgi:hypothetical protein